MLVTSYSHGSLLRTDFNRVNFNITFKLQCSGSMSLDTNVGGNIATINEVSDDHKARFFFS